MDLSVLVVDDSAVMRSMIVRTLRLTGVPLGEIRQASDGWEALDLLRAHRFDLALVDINMPVMNGEELIERVREDPSNRDLSIIVVSTESSESRIRKIMDHGALFVHKPFPPEVLRQAILNATGVPDGRPATCGSPEGRSFDF